MNYRVDKYGNRLSALGFGCMRFQRKNGKVDMELAEKLIRHAVESGINYFDTAYIYPGNEAALGEIFEKTGLRDKVNIATKLPHYLIRSREGIEKLFQEELRRLRTDHVDYYLMHMLNDAEKWQDLRAMGVEDWIREKKASGAIGQIGFSYHGNSENFCKIIDAYDWDFCQVQYNYLDEHSQAGRRGVEYAHSKGIPVIIMEPLRGGRLVNLLPDKAKQIFESYPEKLSPAQWGLRWLWDQQAVTVILSGMNSMGMLQENLDMASRVQVGELNDEHRELYAKVVQAINESVKVGCTGCGYCQPCPKGVDIPGIFAAYNRWHGEDKFGAFMDYLKCTTFRKNATSAGNCIACGKCESHCPQSIEIRKQLKDVCKTMETPLYKLISRCVKIFVRF
ncbi:MAG: aldo/keto reductase [Oscillospiraceae bacterium]|nr:aldo/keto reductase [Oscillospiraceae bacterium]